MLLSLELFLSISPGLGLAQEQKVANPSLTAAYADSADGLQQQFQDFLQIIRSSDQVAVQVFLDSFAIPKADAWFAQHFDPSQASQLAETTKMHSMEFAPTFGGRPEHSLDIQILPIVHRRQSRQNRFHRQVLNHSCRAL
jgi:hypothetical protein